MYDRCIKITIFVSPHAHVHARVPVRVPFFDPNLDQSKEPSVPMCAADDHMKLATYIYSRSI